jgi:hypothetical protein
MKKKKCKLDPFLILKFTANSFGFLCIADEPTIHQALLIEYLFRNVAKLGRPKNAKARKYLFAEHFFSVGYYFFKKKICKKLRIN